jgi:ABC-type nitrate/sulfonate/bicarbonate transport system substrate-binding protein
MNKSIRQVKRALALLLVSSALLSFVGCTRQTDTNTLRIGYDHTTASFVMQYIMLSGLLEEKLPEGVSVEWADVLSSTARRDALVTGSLDISVLNMPAFIAAYENGMPLVMLSGSIIQEGMVFSARPDIRSLGDVDQSHKIAILTIGGVMHLALMLAAEAEFGDANRFDSSLVAMQYPDMFATVETSDMLDIVIAPFPNSLRANEMDKLTPIHDLSLISASNHLGHVMVANKDYHGDNPVLINSFREAFHEAVSFIIENPEQASMLVHDRIYSDIDFEDLVTYVRDVQSPFFEISESAYDNIANLMYEVGIIPNPPGRFAELPNYDSIPKVP